MRAAPVSPQYFGALLVMSGIAVALWPRLTTSEQGPALPGQGAGEVALWSAVMIFSCVPMTLSRRVASPSVSKIILLARVCVWAYSHLQTVHDTRALSCAASSPAVLQGLAGASLAGGGWVVPVLRTIILYYIDVMV